MARVECRAYKQTLCRGREDRCPLSADGLLLLFSRLRGERPIPDASAIRIIHFRRLQRRPLCESAVQLRNGRGMDNARLILSIIVLLAAGYVIVMNWICLVLSQRNKKRGINRHYSTVPFVTILLACLAYILYPYQGKKWIGVTPILDVGNWMLLWLPRAFFWRAKE